MTSPYAFYQYFLNVEDASVITLVKVLTDRTREQVAELEAAVEREPHRRAAQRALAADVTALVHGAQVSEAVQAASEAIFGRGDLMALDAATLADATAELPGGTVAVGATIVDALVSTGLADSRNAARRLVADGGVSVNKVKVSDPEATLVEADFLHGAVALVRRGRKAQAAARRTT